MRRDHKERQLPAGISLGKNWLAAGKAALHAYDYLAYGYLQRGEDEKVQRLVDEVYAARAAQLAGDRLKAGEYYMKVAALLTAGEELPPSAM